MNFLQQISQKPWLTPGGLDEESGDNNYFALPRAGVGLRVFMGVATVVFSLFVITYSDRMLVPDWQAMPEPWLLWVNTAMLVFAGVALHGATLSARRGHEDDVRTRLWVALAFSGAFLVGQALVWRELFALGYFAETNPANAFFYLLTALHGLHLLGGLIALVRTINKFYAGQALEKLAGSVDLCAIYWHFLFVVWLVVFGLLLFT